MTITDHLQVFFIIYLPVINSLMIVLGIFYVWYRSNASISAIKKNLTAIDSIQASVDAQVDKMATKVDKTATKVEKVVAKTEEVVAKAEVAAMHK